MASKTDFWGAIAGDVAEAGAWPMTILATGAAEIARVVSLADDAFLDLGWLDRCEDDCPPQRQKAQDLGWPLTRAAGVVTETTRVTTGG